MSRFFCRWIRPGAYSVQRGGEDFGDRASSTTRSYLRVAMAGPTLRILTNALTEKIPFATGIAFALDGEPRTAGAASEMISCGGTVNSPGLLMLSGDRPVELWSTSGLFKGPCDVWHRRDYRTTGRP
jgi:choline dehydrogenase-like flavoprotein